MKWNIVKQIDFIVRLVGITVSWWWVKWCAGLTTVFDVVLASFGGCLLPSGRLSMASCVIRFEDLPASHWRRYAGSFLWCSGQATLSPFAVSFGKNLWRRPCFQLEMLQDLHAYGCNAHAASPVRLQSCFCFFYHPSISFSKRAEFPSSAGAFWNSWRTFSGSSPFVSIAGLAERLSSQTSFQSWLNHVIPVGLPLIHKLDDHGLDRLNWLKHSSRPLDCRNDT